MKHFFLIVFIAHAFILKAYAEDRNISSAAELVAFAEAVNAGGDFSGNHVLLTADIDLATYEAWTPIGTDANPFQGTFNGGGHRISNLQVKANALETGFVGGLFGRIAAAGIVQDLTVSSLSVLIEDNGGYDQNACQIGAIAGRNDGRIVGCANRGVSVFGNWDNAYVGGIAGYNTGAVENCYNLGRIFTGSSYNNNNLGGIVGFNAHGAEVSNCFVRAEVTQNVSGSSRSGAICGNNLGSVASCFYMDATSEDATLVLQNSADNEAALASADGLTNQNVLLSDRTIFSDEAWNTLCLPFDLPGAGNGRSPIAGATVRELDVDASGFRAATGVLTLDFVEVTDIRAGRPYIVKWDEAISEDLHNPLFLGVTIANKNAAERTVATSDATVDFIGQFSALSIPTEDKSLLYLGDGNLLFYPNAAMQIGACRAYFRLPGLQQGADAVRGVVLNFYANAAVSGISPAVAVPSTSPAAVCCTLDGRKVRGRALSRGIYVVNGKKVLMK